MPDVSVSDVTYEDLARLEQEFDDAELQTRMYNQTVRAPLDHLLTGNAAVREQHKIYAPLYKKRQEVVAKIPNFWALVLEQAPTEFENYTTPSDSQVFADALKSIEVERFEIDDPNGSPRSVVIRFHFDSNEYFEDKVLEKKFWHRRALDGWSGIVSEPVKINWKKGKDLTQGLTDAAFALFAARKKQDAAQNGSSNGKAKASKITKLPEYKAIIDKIENNTEAALSFFTWFGFISSHGYVSAEESAEANKKEAEKRAKWAKGEKVEDEDENDEKDDEDDFFDESEICPNGEEVAEIIVNELWPQAIKYFTAAQEADDDDLSELEDADIDDEDDDDEPVDIRSLVPGKGKGKENGSSASPPPKKRRT
ncbi:hypothetical protein IWX46DRAFT_582379 [Phyllosticta citricarpa]|uniref:Nucleosome assembly protein n=1 Tax=Phyllosticta citricarpa TaxID=55181 RepID=A0ABR1M413_9PEZI